LTADYAAFAIFAAITIAIIFIISYSFAFATLFRRFRFQLSMIDYAILDSFRYYFSAISLLSPYMPQIS
jgi:hypothetical protein